MGGGSSGGLGTLFKVMWEKTLLQEVGAQREFLWSSGKTFCL